MGRKEIESASAGDIVTFSGIEDVTIGNTICEAGVPNPINFVKITDPTVEMTFSVNDSPFAGKEGKFVTSRQIRDRLHGSCCGTSRCGGGFRHHRQLRVMGRGEMHLVDPDREDAPRGLRVSGIPPEGALSHR